MNEKQVKEELKYVKDELKQVQDDLKNPSLSEEEWERLDRLEDRLLSRRESLEIDLL